MTIILQIFLNGLISSSYYLLVALGLMIVYRIAGFLHFAHGILVTTGAYLAFTFYKWIKIPYFISIIAAIISTMLICYLIDAIIYRPLRRKKASALILLLASLGVYILLQNSISLIFGDDTKMLTQEIYYEGLNFFGAKITVNQVIIISVSIASLLIMNILFRNTKLGKKMRAVANNRDLAELSGIECEEVILWAIAIASALAGLAGVLLAIDTDITPTMGMRVLMMGVVAVIIGGTKTVLGIALGSLLLGTAQQLSVWIISSQWQDVVAFVILLTFLIIKPEKKLRNNAVKAMT